MFILPLTILLGSIIICLTEENIFESLDTVLESWDNILSALMTPSSWSRLHGATTAATFKITKTTKCCLAFLLLPMTILLGSIMIYLTGGAISESWDIILAAYAREQTTFVNYNTRYRHYYHNYRLPPSELEPETFYNFCYFMGDFVLLSTHPGVNSERLWTMDSGCSRHFCKDISWFTSIKKCTPIEITCASGEMLYAYEKGEVTIHTNVTLTDVYLVRRGLARNLLCVSALCKAGWTVAFDSRKCKISRTADNGDRSYFNVPTATRTKDLKKTNQFSAVGTGSVEIPLDHTGRMYSVEVPQRKSNLNKAGDMNAALTDDLIAAAIEEINAKKAATSETKKTLPVKNPDPPPPPPERDKYRDIEFQGGISELLHNRFAHTNFRGLMTLARKGLVLGIPSKIKDIAGICKECAMAKSHQLSFKKERATVRARGIAMKFHSDIKGPFKTRDRDGNRFILTFIDDHSRRGFVYLLKSKDETAAILKQEIRRFKTEVGISMACLRTDGGTEYFDLDEFMVEQGITHEVSLPYTHQLLGVAERYNRVLIESSIAMLTKAGLGEEWWGCAVVAANHIHGYRLNSTLVNNHPNEIHHTPLGCWYDSKPDASNLRVMFSRCYAYIPSEKRKKNFKPRARECMLIGFGGSTEKNEIYQGWKLYDIHNKSISYSRHVVFDENIIGLQKKDFPTDRFSLISPMSLAKEEADIRKAASKRKRSDSTTRTTVSKSKRSTNTAPKRVSERLSKLRAKRTSDESAWTAFDSPGGFNTINWIDEKRKSSHIEAVIDDLETTESSIDHLHKTLTHHSLFLESELTHQYDTAWLCEADLPETIIDPANRCEINAITDNAALIARLVEKSKPRLPDPKNIAECEESEHKTEWRKARLAELNKIYENETWKLVKKVAGMIVTKTKWVFKVKYDVRGSIEKFKARLVACGYNQVKGVNFDLTYSPVARLTSIKAMIALAARLNLTLYPRPA